MLTETSPLFTAIYDWPVADAIRQNEFAFPVIECLHVLSICSVVGIISIVDLRLLGLRAHTPRIRTLLGQLIPIVWGAFVLAAISGGLLFASNATGYAKNFDFQVKMALMVLAFLNMLAFHIVGRTRLAAWDEAERLPVAARLSGGVSLLLWIAVVVFGRQIGFTLMPF
jgi:hypothetical protein